MPLYEYECVACKRHTEKIQKFSDPEITVCPHCAGELKRVISAPAFSMKGGGWYADGYGSVKPAASSDGGASDGGAKSEGGGADKAAAAPAASPATAAPAPASTPAASAPAASSSSDKK
jgi:putative FmdB family regulatory protein